MQEQENILRNTILTSLPSVKSLNDLVELLNKIFVLKYPKLSDKKCVTLKQLKFFAAQSKTLYHSFYIKKKSGKLREISAPVHGLKLIQELINEILVAVYAPNDNACGFVRGKSITDGANKHVNQHFVLNLDLKDFFDSFEWYQVRNLFRKTPFAFPESENKSDNLPLLLAYLCCYPKEVERYVDGEYRKETRYVLPQGAPCSPMLTNMLCRTLDARLAGLAKKYGAQYSRYADDISFSHSRNIFKNDSSFRAQVKQIIEATPHLRINDDKTRLQGRRYRQEVTGIIVNDKVNVPQRYINQIRKWLYFWEHYGYQKANALFTEFYMLDKGHVKHICPGLENVLAGKLNYLKMIKGAENPTFVKLHQRYMFVSGQSKQEMVLTQNKSDNVSIYDILQMLVDAI